MTEMHEFIKHIEKYLGLISSGKKSAIGARTLPFQVVRFDNQPVQRAVTYTTLGLSNNVLQHSSGHRIRQELCLCFDSRYQNLMPEMYLFTVGNDLLVGGQALSNGDVLEPRGPLFPTSQLEAFYCTFPLFFPEEFHVFDQSEPEVAFVLLLPICPEEAMYILNHGWKSFEGQVFETDMDLLDLYRPCIV